MSKKRKSFSLEPEVASYLDNSNLNASSLVNDLLEKHMVGGVDDGQAVLEFRIEQVESEVSELESQLDRKREELQALRERRDEKREAQTDVIREAASALTDGELANDDQKVDYWANQAGLTRDELREKVHELRP